MVLVSMAGLVLAAWGAGALARSFSTARVVVGSLWLTGLASPLLFDGYIFIAHTLGAACVAWSLVLVVRREGRPGLDAQQAVRIGGPVAVGVLLRAAVVLLAVARSETRPWGKG